MTYYPLICYELTRLKFFTRLQKYYSPPVTEFWTKLLYHINFHIIYTENVLLFKLDCYGLDIHMCKFQHFPDTLHFFNEKNPLIL